MKWCVKFPEEDILIKRPSLKRACGGNKAAATFLSYLLYQVSISREYKRTAENMNKRQADSEEMPNQQLVTGSVYRTQLQIIEEIDNELSDRTLRDTAIPWLVALGYIEVDDSHPINIYVVHVEQVQKAINHPPDGKAIQEVKARFQSLTGKISDAQTTGKTSVSNGTISVSNGKTSDATGKTSVSNGKTSDGKNGIRSTPQAASNTVLRRHKNSKSNYESIRIEESDTNNIPTTSAIAANAATITHTLLEIENLTSEEVELATKTILEQRRQQTPPPLGKTAPSSSIESKQKETGKNEKTATKPTGRKTASKPEISLQAVVILSAWSLIVWGTSDRETPRTKDNLIAAEELARINATENDLRNVRDRLLAQKDGFWKSRGVSLKNIANNFHLAASGPLSSQASARPASDASAQRSQSATRGTGLSEGEATELARSAIEMARAKDHEITATPNRLETGVWAVIVDWKTKGASPMPIKNCEEWDRAFKAMCCIWEPTVQKQKEVIVNG